MNHREKVVIRTSIISILANIVLAGFTAFVESVKKIIYPQVADYSTITLVILIFGIIVKFILGLYVKKVGKRVNSDSLVASGTDAFNDGILSISVLVSAIIYILFKISLEAYVGVVLALFIIRSGFHVDLEEKRISFDIIIDFKIKNREDIYKEIFDEVQSKYLEYDISITLDVDVSD